MIPVEKFKKNTLYKYRDGYMFLTNISGSKYEFMGFFKPKKVNKNFKVGNRIVMSTMHKRNSWDSDNFKNISEIEDKKSAMKEVLDIIFTMEDK